MEERAWYWPLPRVMLICEGGTLRDGYDLSEFHGPLYVNEDALIFMEFPAIEVLDADDT